MKLPSEDEWPTWTRIDPRTLEHARSEEPFFETATALVTEFGQLTQLLARASQRPAASEAARLRDSVLRGLAVRTVKLTRRLIAESFEGRGEMQSLLDRELFETISTVGYLLRGAEQRTQAFVEDSLRADRRVWEHVERNRVLREGEALPQEQRMRARLEESFRLAGSEPDEGAHADDWPSLEDRLAAVGEPDAHAMHELGADVVHGLWNELVSHHLDGDEADLDWSAPRVQPLHAVAIQGGRVMAAYARALGHEVSEAFRDKFLDVAHRAADGDRLHEEYLARASLRIEDLDE